MLRIALGDGHDRARINHGAISLDLRVEAGPKPFECRRCADLGDALDVLGASIGVRAVVRPGGRHDSDPREAGATSDSSDPPSPAPSEW